jgi:hypothetical protein
MTGAAVAVAFAESVMLPVATVSVSVVGIVTVSGPEIVSTSAAMIVAVAFADIVRVYGATALTDTMVVPAGMPTPLMGCPTNTPVTVDTVVRIGLPAVVMPVAAATRLVAVAFADIVMLYGATVFTDTMVVPAGMPVPVMGCPTSTPARFETAPTIGLRAVTTPVGATVLEAVAAAEIVIALDVTPVMTVLAGMPVPVMTCPIASPVVVDTVPIVLLAEVTTPVGVALVPPATAMIAALVGIPAPCTIWPTEGKIVPSIP